MKARRADRAIHFAPGSARIARGGRRLIQVHAKYLLKRPQMVAALVGHRDPSEHLDGVAHLGRARAAVVRDALEELGVPRPRMTIASFGNRMPFDTSRRRGAHAANRRVDILYFGPTELGGSPPLKARTGPFAGSEQRRRRCSSNS